MRFALREAIAVAVQRLWSPVYRAEGREAVSEAWCVGCWLAVTFQRDLPSRCSVCGGSKFRPIATLSAEPKVPYEITIKDVRFLESLRIDPEVPEAS